MSAPNDDGAMTAPSRPGGGDGPGGTAAVVRGMAVAAVVAVPVGVASQRLAPGSGWAVVAFAVIVVALVAGGFVAGRAGPRRALTHGALAGLGTYLAIQAVGVTARLIRGDSVTWSAIPFVAMLSTGCGILGGFLAEAVEHRRRAVPDRPAPEEGPL